MDHFQVYARSQWEPHPEPDVVFVQAGVGGLACAVISWLCHHYANKRPFTIVCEPANAACLLQAARAGTPTPLMGPFDTIMAGLRCGEVSPLAWPALSAGADAFVAIDDEWAMQAMRALAHPRDQDATVTAGASGACGLGTMLATLDDSRLDQVRTAAGISARSRILVINTEGATDPELYERVMENRRSDA
ncbi:MAG: pyridoxal-phosphate dependent enzyme [Acidobacteriota bacterium]